MVRRLMRSNRLATCEGIGAAGCCERSDPQLHSRRPGRNHLSGLVHLAQDETSSHMWMGQPTINSRCQNASTKPFSLAHAVQMPGFLRPRSMVVRGCPSRRQERGLPSGGANPMRFSSEIGRPVTRAIFATLIPVVRASLCLTPAC